MYRQYENPYELQKQLEELKMEMQKAVEENANEDTLISFAYDIAELEERINFAWQDEEYDENY